MIRLRTMNLTTPGIVLLIVHGLIIAGGSPHSGSGGGRETRR
jgi:hypothetical protein